MQIKLNAAGLIAAGGCAVSAVFSGIGVSTLYGFETPLAQLSSVGLIGLATLTLIGAAFCLLWAQREFQTEGAFAKLKGGAIVAGFIALTLGNMVASHRGLETADAAAVQARLAPLERTLTDAQAKLGVATAALQSFDRDAAQAAQTRAQALQTAVRAGYVTSGARALGAAPDAEAGRAARRALAEAQAQAQAEVSRAETALSRAPRGTPENVMWGLAGLLELIMGAMVWFAAPSARKVAKKGDVIRLDVSAIASMAVEDLDALEKQARSIAARCQQEKARRRKAEEAAAEDKVARRRKLIRAVA